MYQEETLLTISALQNRDANIDASLPAAVDTAQGQGLAPTKKQKKEQARKAKRAKAEARAGDITSRTYYTPNTSTNVP